MEQKTSVRIDKFTSEKTRKKMAAGNKLDDRKLISSFWSISEVLYATYNFLFGIKCFLHLTVHCIYLSLLESLEDTNNSEIKHTITDQIKFIQMLLYSMGDVYRAIGPTGLFCNSVFLLCCIIYSISLFTGGRGLNYIKDNNFIAFLIEPEAEYARISERIDNFLKQLTYSNVNYTRSIFCMKEKEVLVSEARRERPTDTSSSVRFLHLIQIIEGVNRAENSFQTTNTRGILWNKMPHQIHLTSSREILINSLSKQVDHLNTLKLNKQSIWPANRNRSWAEKVKLVWFRIYAGIYIGIWFSAIILILLSYYIAARSIKTHNHKFDVYFTKVNRLDRLCIADYLIYSLIAVHWFIAPLTVTIVCIMDQLVCLNSLKPRVDRIRNKIKAFNMISEEYMHNNLFLDSSKSKFNIDLRKARDLLRIDCDKETIDLYISYRLSEGEIKSAVELIQRAVGQSVTFSFLSTILPLLYYSSNLSKDQYFFLTMAGLLINVTINVVLCSCAALHSSYQKTSNIMWSLIAFEESFVMDLKTKGTFVHAAQAKPESHSQERDRISITNNQHHSMINIDLEYYLSSSITPHTLSLWRRLVANYDILIENSVGRLYGILKIDYNGILRFNFWFISLALIVLTYKDE